MVATDQIIEIEIDGSKNENIVFRPLQRRLRGRFDLNRINEPTARMKHETFPEPIPGQRVRVNLATKEAFVVEPLSTPEFTAVRQRYEFDEHSNRPKFVFAPAAEAIADAHLPSILYWMQAEVKAGTARLIAGTFPAINEKPKRRYYSPEKPDEKDSIAKAMQSMADAFAANTAVLEKVLAKLK